MSIKQIYNKLYETYGPQGWWPLINHKGTNPTKSGSIEGYHVEDYSYPKDDNEMFEICIGAILTQNTNWSSVEKTLINLKELDAIDPNKLLDLEEEKLKEAIKPAGYFNQKAKKLKIFAKFFINKNKQKEEIPTREELLLLWGIGPETADSILLYAYKQPSFVVDAYTRRIFSHLGTIKDNATYDEIKDMFEKELSKDIIVYQEYHALIVEHAKRYYSKKPYDDPLLINHKK